MRSKIGLLGILVVTSLPLFASSTTTWQTRSGEWAITGNWTNGIPNSTDITAIFNSVRGSINENIGVTGTYDVGTLEFSGYPYGRYSLTGANGLLNLYTAITSTTLPRIICTVALQNNVIITAGTSNGIYFAGPVTGTGGIILNSGSLIFSNTNDAVTYSGPIIINNGSLLSEAAGALSPNSAFILADSIDATLTLNGFIATIGSLSGGAASSVALNGEQLTLGADGTGTTYYGTISDGGVTPGGGITKVGGGIFTLAGTNTFTGTLIVEEGVVALTGSITNDATVLGGRLIGNGTVGGNLLLSAGTLAPGAPSGSNTLPQMTVNGNYTQQSGSTYQVQVNGLAENTLLAITDTATIDDGSILDITSSDGSYNVNQPYTILTATGGISTTGSGFSTINIAPLSFAPTITYDPYAITLSLTSNFINVGKNSNQRHVATQISSIASATSEQQVLIDNLVTQSLNRMQSGFEEMSGDQYANLMLCTERTNQHFFNTLYDPLRSFLSNPCTPCSCETSNWIDVSGVRSDYTGDEHAYGFKTHGYTIATGIQTAIRKEVVLGASLFYEADNYTYNSEGNGREYTILGGVYGLYRPKDYYILAEGIFGFGFGRVDRTITVGSVQYFTTGRPQVNQVALYAEAGKDFIAGLVLIQPFIGVDVGYFNYLSFQESGDAAIPLTLPTHNYCSSNSHVGIHLYTRPSTCGLTLGLDADWVCRLTSLNDHRLAAFQEFGNLYTVEGIQLARNGFEGALFASQLINKHWKVYAQASTALWENAVDGSILGGVAYSW